MDWLPKGRDMTTVVFPNADLKIYLDASVKERAKRRYKQLMIKGKDVSIQNLTDDITARDKLDMERIHSPLSIADDAFVLNSDDLKH
jgi:cytidylate kinase